MPKRFPKWLHHFTFPSSTYEVCNFSTFLFTFVIACLFYFNHLSGYLSVDFICNPLMTSDISISYAVIGHLSIFFERTSVQNLCLFFNWVVFVLLSSKSSFYILDINFLSHSWWCPLNQERNFILIKSNLLTFSLLLVLLVSSVRNHCLIQNHKDACGFF